MNAKHLIYHLHASAFYKDLMWTLPSRSSPKNHQPSRNWFSTFSQVCSQPDNSAWMKTVRKYHFNTLIKSFPRTWQTQKTDFHYLKAYSKSESIAWKKAYAQSLGFFQDAISRLFFLFCLFLELFYFLKEQSQHNRFIKIKI